PRASPARCGDPRPSGWPAAVAARGAAGIRAVRRRRAMAQLRPRRRRHRGGLGLGRRDHEGRAGLAVLGLAVQLGGQPGGGDDAVSVVAELGDLGPVGVAVESHANPAAAADVGRPEEALRVGRGEFLLRSWWRRAPQVRELVVVMAVGPERHERALAADEPGRRTMARPLADLGQRHADPREPLAQIAHLLIVPSAAGDTLLPMKFAIAIPQFYADGEFDPTSFREYLMRAEELGFESAWTQESTLGFGPQLSPIEAMTYAAACTERIRLGRVVFVSTLRSPGPLA